MQVCEKRFLTKVLSYVEVVAYEHSYWRSSSEDENY